MRHLCPVCGFRGLIEAPRSLSGGGSYEICPSCGFEFGVSDDDLGHSYESWREAWIAKGMKWYSRGLKQPAEWNPKQQVADIAAPAAMPAKSSGKKETAPLAKKPAAKPSASAATSKPARKKAAAKK